MKWIDSGVNLLDKRFILDEVLERAYQADISHLLIIASNLQESCDALSLCHTQRAMQYNGQKSIKLACTAGVHPHYADDADSSTWIKLNSIIADNSISAIGECGLDFNRNFSSQKNQLYAFESQLAIAAKHNLGVYLHERDAFDEQITLLEQYSDSLKFMVTHCFTGNTSHLNEYVKLGCFIGITGWLCDAKRGIDLQEAVCHLPLERLLLETDAPYLFPKTLRPRRSTNEPCNIPHIAQHLTDLTGHSLQTVQAHAYENALKLFFNRKS